MASKSRLILAHPPLETTEGSREDREAAKADQGISRPAVAPKADPKAVHRPRQSGRHSRQIWHQTCASPRPLLKESETVVQGVRAGVNLAVWLIGTTKCEYFFKYPYSMLM